ncbi:hypothetical protein PPL_08392 [Heterostelium album PN500]|uniref:Uncharacterized protein n=1 Tax=Heterostelium pallidum (strain ATCC 26659 / Pp 5 / PN500) TaxID=670386 RepID=D3BI24_HETP5|nr:hypothetical protein PPL_08392 [Heterostelium album PN500]EFA78924.1 hypothetical protein PPL_08392 [Heterostelium album PN500]|eukprot:XP_020431048.1 hypothetical protein PPL_08392 [Heterostelium album PN500]
MTQQQLYLKSIDCGPTGSNSYNKLANTLSSEGESITLNNGQSMTQQLYLKAIECDPENLLSYNNLTTTLLRGKSVILPNRQIMTAQQLYLKAKQINFNKIYY